MQKYLSKDFFFMDVLLISNTKAMLGCQDHGVIRLQECSHDSAYILMDSIMSVEEFI